MGLVLVHLQKHWLLSSDILTQNLFQILTVNFPLTNETIDPNLNLKGHKILADMSDMYLLNLDINHILVRSF